MESFTQNSYSNGCVVIIYSDILALNNIILTTRGKNALLRQTNYLPEENILNMQPGKSLVMMWPSWVNFMHIPLRYFSTEIQTIKYYLKRQTLFALLILSIRLKK